MSSSKHHHILLLHLSGKIKDRSNGDIAVDEYHRYKVQYYPPTCPWFFNLCVNNINIIIKTLMLEHN